MTERSARRAIVGLAVAVLVGAAAACDDDGSSGGGITIQASDSTPPELSLSVAVAGGTEKATVEPGGTAQTFTLPNRTGTLNLAATAKDEQTGVQRVQIWMTTTVTSCDSAGVCSGGNPTLPGQPLFESTQPAKSPGETTAASSIELEALPLSDAIKGSAPPGGTLSVELELHAVAVNHLGQRAQTAKVTVIWDE
jgi:hypothetical protein